MWSKFDSHIEEWSLEPELGLIDCLRMTYICGRNGLLTISLAVVTFKEHINGISVCSKSDGT